MNKWGGSPVRCEVCKDHATHENSEVVGRKASGVCRVVHRRPACQKKWRKKAKELMARWPERRAAKSTAAVIVTAVDAAPVAAVVRQEELKMAKPIEQHTTSESVAPSNLTLSLATPPVHRGRKYLTAGALDDRIRSHFKTHPWQRNAALVLYSTIEATEPVLLRTTDGGVLPRTVFSSRCSTIVARMANSAAPHPDEVKDVDALRADLVKARDEAAHWKRAHDLQRTASALGEEVVGIVAGLVYRIDIDTLRTVRDLLRK